MPGISFIQKLPPDLQEELRRQFVANGFGNYTGVFEWLQTELENRELDLTVSRSAVAVQGKQHRQFIEKIRETVELSKALGDTTPDERADIANALATIVPAKILDKLVDEENEPKIDELIKIGRILDKIIGATHRQKRHMQAFNAELEQRKAAAAQEVDAQARREGWTDKDVDWIKSKILGISVDEPAG